MKDSFNPILKEPQDKINRQFEKRIKRLESLVTEDSEDDANTDSGDDNTNTDSGDNDGSGSEEP